jgi:hypothetical protein
VDGLQGAILHRAAMLQAKGDPDYRRHPGRHPDEKFLRRAATEIFEQEGAEAGFRWRLEKPEREVARVVVEPLKGEAPKE